MPVHIGGKDSYKQRITGDIVSSYQWVNGEPAMILWPKVPKLGGGAYVICLSSAFKYADINYLVVQAAIAAQFMGMDTSSFTTRRIADVILDGLEDLVRMPMERPGVNEQQLESIGEATIKVDGQVIAEREITVPQGIAA
jgi:hypothetical protein